MGENNINEEEHEIEVKTMDQAEGFIDELIAGLLH